MLTGVRPLDGHSRVRLDPAMNPDRCDYINASFLQCTSPAARRYIAAQAPIPATVADFWQMVWEQQVATIVMLVVPDGQRVCVPAAAALCDASA